MFLLPKFKFVCWDWLHVYLLILHTSLYYFSFRLIVGGPKPCASNPCGANSVCQDTPNGAGYICTCKEGYTGQPFRGCTGKHILKIYIQIFLFIFETANFTHDTSRIVLIHKMCHYVPRKKDNQVFDSYNFFDV